MEAKILKSLAVLGVPGVALGLFYLLFRTFNFRFGVIGPTGAAIIAVIFVVTVGGVVVFALHRYAPAATPPQDHSLQHGKMERIETRKENWIQEACDHAENVIRHIDATRATAVEEGLLMEPDRIDLAILEALTPEYSPAKLEDSVKALDDDALKEALANVKEAFMAVRMAQMDLAHGAAPASEEYEPIYVVQWYHTQLTNFASVARRLLTAA